MTLYIHGSNLLQVHVTTTETFNIIIIMLLAPPLTNQMH